MKSESEKTPEFRTIGEREIDDFFVIVDRIGTWNVLSFGYFFSSLLLIA